MLYILLILVNFLYIQAQENITIIGIGRLGLCTALCFAKVGYKVLGVDINIEYINSLNNKTFDSPEPHVNELLRNTNNFKATCSLEEGLNFSEIYYILVDTPSTTANQAYDHTKLGSILTEINKRKINKKHIIIGCTIFPGYIDTIGNFLLKDCIDCTLSYNPEFIAQGNIIYGLQNPDIILIGEGSKEAGDKLQGIYDKVCINRPKICRMSPASAEITKLAINCFITTKIAYSNMIGDIADQTPYADKFAILDAVGGDKRIGSLCLTPGYGFGGPCFPRDNRALGYYAQTIGINSLIPEATDLSNKLHAEFMVQELSKENRSHYIFKGVGYKEDCAIPIIEESQKLAIAASLAKKGNRVTIVDKPNVIIQVQQQFGNIFQYEII